MLKKLKNFGAKNNKVKKTRILINKLFFSTKITKINNMLKLC